MDWRVYRCFSCLTCGLYKKNPVMYGLASVSLKFNCHGCYRLSTQNTIVPAICTKYSGATTMTTQLDCTSWRILVLKFKGLSLEFSVCCHSLSGSVPGILSILLLDLTSSCPWNMFVDCLPCLTLPDSGLHYPMGACLHYPLWSFDTLSYHRFLVGCLTRNCIKTWGQPNTSGPTCLKVMSSSVCSSPPTSSQSPLTV